MSKVSGNRFDALLHEQMERQTEALHPDLQPWVEEDGPWGKMLRHPLVYAVPLVLPSHANEAYAYKRRALAEAREEGDWHTVVFLHERPYRLRALIDYVTGRYDVAEDGDIIPLDDLPIERQQQATLDLVADVWVDSENIEQCEDDWRALIGKARTFWLGDESEREAFDALPDPIPAWRGGTTGDWSWTTRRETAEFFTRRSGYEPRFALIPKADCFGYLTRRGEYELMVRLTDARYPLVYPNRVAEFLETEDS